MRRRTMSCLTLLAVCAAGGAVQSSGQGTGATPGSGTPAPADIRQVDFLNLDYRSSLCAKEFGKQGIGRTVRVREGEFKSRNVYFAVEGERILYGDLTGDGREEAVVPVSCGAVGANFDLSEVSIFAVEKGRPVLVAQISDKEMERDYRRSYPETETYWGTTGEDLKVREGQLAIEVLADGPHASPRYVVTLDYKLSGKRLQLVGKPQRRDASQ
jgi:hypothetical protein